MPINTPASAIRVSIDATEAQNTAKKLGETLKASLVPVIDVGNLAGKALNSVKDFLKGTLDAAIQQEQAELKLATALRLKGQEVDSTVARLNKYNRALQQQTGIGDEVLLGLESQLSALGVHGKQLELATQATIGLSEATGKDLSGAAKDISKLLRGQVSEDIKGLGIDVTDSGASMQQLARFTDLATERTKTFGGQVDLLKANLRNLQETVGSSVTKSETVVGSLSFVNKVTVGFNEQLKNTGKLFDIIANSAPVEALLGLGGAALTSLPGVSQLAATLKSLAEEGEKASKISLGGKGSKSEILEQLRKSARASLGLGDEDNPEQLAGEGERARAAILGNKGKGRFAPGKRIDLDILDLGALSDADRLANEIGLGAPNAAFGGFGQPGLTGGASLTESEAQRISDQTKARIEAFQDAEKRVNQARIEAAEEGDREWEKSRREAQISDLDRIKGFSGELVQVGVGGISSFFAQLAAGAAAGEEDFGTITKRALGGLISSLGTTLISAGTAALASATLGGFFPFLRLEGFGGPEGIPAAVAAIGVGAGLVAAGQALGASGASQAPKTVGSGVGSGSTSKSDFSPTGNAPRGFQFKGSELPGERVVIVNISGSIFGGDPRKVGRELQDLITRSSSLNSGGARG